MGINKATDVVIATFESDPAVQWLGSGHVTNTILKHKLQDLEELKAMRERAFQLWVSGLCMSCVEAQLEHQIAQFDCQIKAKQKAITNLTVREVDNG